MRDRPGQGQEKHDKRATEKDRDGKREVAQAMKVHTR
jgi:SsrA-binding protein